MPVIRGTDSPTLRTVLETVGAIAADLDLDVTLQRIIDAATELSGARYGALGVLDEADHRGQARTLREFVTHGISPVQRELIGSPPTGHGVLGVLIDHPEPLRIDDLTTHPLSSGFPANHPSMRTFLGAPIRIGTRVFGNLYLTERSGGGPFTDEDVEVVVAFAAAAGVIIENARLYERLSRRRRWLEAAAEVSRVILGEQGSRPPTEVIGRNAMAAGEADGAVMLLAAPSGALRVAASVGAPATGPLADPLADPRVEDVWQTGTPVAPSVDGDMLVRIDGSDRISGVLALHWAPERLDRVHDSTVESAQAFADQIALVLEVALAQDDRARLAVYEDRDRIGRDLHDLVIQRLFAVGLTLENTARIAGPGQLANRVNAAVDQLDETIKDIRRTIFELANPDRPDDLYDDVQSAVDDLLPSLGFRPAVTMSGPLNTTVHDQVRTHLLAVLREALSNIGRHAGAGAAAVSISLAGSAGPDGPTEVVLVVEDDGRGLPAAAGAPGESGNGLPNMRARADVLGGTCELGPGPDGGTRLVWRVPVG
ncbi:GAF domain-containing protein [Nakamurella sp.]|uniref:GAF domain-containing sensor histidine kinase n=1 Tax=Nakamurella sp. TaxID=1869182 RepID=UPI003B3A877F